MKEKIVKLSRCKLEIEHIGSTAVKELGGKGIIDISIGIKNWKETEDILAILKKLGFKHFHDIERNSIFVSSKAKCEEGDFHVHISRINTKRYRRTLAFRDFLRSNSAEAREYGKLKQKVFKECKRDQKSYKNLKNKYFSELSVSHGGGNKERS